MIFVTLILDGDATQTGIDPQTGKVGLLFTTSAELFSFLVEGKGLADLIRFFDLRTKWDRRQYRLLTENEAVFLSKARKRFIGPSIASLYYLRKRNRLPSRSAST